MKTILICKKTFFTLFAAGIMTVPVLLSSCNKDYNGTNSSSQMYTTTGSASGAQENPPVTSSGTGTLTGTYNAQTNAWQYNITWSAISDVATAVELHGPAGAGVNGNLVSALTITAPGITGSASGNVTFTDQQETDLLAGKYYYTILTVAHVTGEIRGQIAASLQ